MGLANVGSSKADTFEWRDPLVTALGYVAATLVAGSLVAIVAALVTLSWQDFSFVIASPGPLGAARPLALTGIIVLVALPATFAAGVFAAVCATDVNIGGFVNKALCEALEWSLGVPPVVVGAAVFFVATFAPQSATILVAALALVVLNLPNATARLAQAFATVSPQAREAAAALGASAVTVFFGLVQPRTTWALAAVFFGLMGQMIGETSAVVLAISARTGPEPLSVAIWHFASNISLASSEAALSVVLVLACAICLAGSRACLRRHVEKMREPA